MDEKERRKKRRIILENLKNGATKTKACAEADIDRRTLYRWMALSKIFKRDVEEAIEIQIGVVEDMLYKGAAEGDLAAQKFFLCNRAPNKWKDATRHEIGGSLELTYANLVKAKKEREKNKK